MADRGPVPVLIGCTATGKTGILLELARNHDIQVINADSRQIYIGMNIGTAKPDEMERSILPHHMLDIITPDEVFSAGDFARAAEKVIEEIRVAGSIPVVSGGTALYVMALTGSLDPLPKRCTELREGLMELEKEVPGVLMRMLRRVDGPTASKLGERDLRRQIRAIEIYFLSGMPASSLRRGGDPEKRKNFRIVGIEVEGEELRRRIRKRILSMMDRGLVDEVRGLLDGGWDGESALGGTIGYSEVLDFLNGDIPGMDELINSIEINTWRLARRQRNMFRRIREVTWVEDDPALVEKLLFCEGGD